jgi:hypothetical protein
MPLKVCAVNGRNVFRNLLQKNQSSIFAALAAELNTFRRSSGGACLPATTMLPRPAATPERESCLLVLNTVTSIPQWIRQPRPRGCVFGVCVFGVCV